MKCPWCGARSEVLETRDEGQRRTRQCFNMHRFRTHEVLTDPPRRQWQRDKAIALAVHRGLTHPEAAIQFKVGRSTVYRATLMYKGKLK